MDGERETVDGKWWEVDFRSVYKGPSRERNTELPENSARQTMGAVDDEAGGQPPGCLVSWANKDSRAEYPELVPAQEQCRVDANRLRIEKKPIAG